MNTSLHRPIALVSALLLAIFVAAPVLAVAPAPGAFERTWERTDRPVAEDEIDRTWIWGPEANTPVLQEEYRDSPGNMRDVQYFDKSRMEINNPNAVDDGLWYVTNGLLVVELMTGMMQVGHDDFEERWPAEINIVGDPGYDETPTYADYADLQDNAAHPAGSVITATVDGDGNIGNDNDLAQWNVTADELAPLTGHRTASVFWEFMNSSGTVYEDGEYTTDRLFENAYYATGYPITEAYWSQVMLLGSEQWVLTQAFERRVLTYAPNNNEGFQVEAGNVGMHYYQWRYETDPPVEPDESGTINVTTFENDGTTAQGDITVEVFLLDEGQDCDVVDFDTDEPAASGTTDAATGVFSFSDLDVGTYCVAADFDDDGEAGDATFVAVVTAGGTVNVSLSNPEAETPPVEASVTVTVLGDDDLFVAGATVQIFAGSCDDIVAGDDALATGVTTGAGTTVLNVTDVEAGTHCVIVSNVGGEIGRAEITLPDDTAVTIGGATGVTVTSPEATNEVQRLSASGALAGTFTLTFDGETTGPIAYNASSADIQVALQALSNLNPGDVTVSGGLINTADVTIEFTGGLALTNVPQIQVNSDDLEGVTLSVTTLTPGEAGTDEVQVLAASGATGGTFTLTFDDDTTADIDFNANAGTIRTALEALPGIDVGDVVVTGGPAHLSNVTITFVNELGETNVDQITGDGSDLEGSVINVTTVTEGQSQVIQVVSVGSAVTGGTFTLTYAGQTTAPIDFDATAAEVEAALEALPNISNVTVTGNLGAGGSVTITFLDPSPPTSLLVVNDSLIT